MPRKGENIYKRKDGRWEARYIKDRGSNNKAIYGYIYGKSYKEVKEKKKTISNRPHLIESKMYYNEWLIIWLEVQRHHIKESTYTTYYLHIKNHIQPVLGNYDIREIKNYDIQNFINEKLSNGRLDSNGSLSSKTVKELVNIIKLSLKYAIKNEIIKSINLDFRINNSKKELELLSKEEYHILIKYLIVQEKPIAKGILLMLLTGVRVGELCALKNKDIDFIDKTLLVNKTLQRISDVKNGGTKIVIQTTKTKKSNRQIPIPDDLFNYLHNSSNIDDYFLTQSDKYMEPRTFSYAFKRIIKKLHLSEVTVHSLRHLFASQCIELGFDYNCLSEILGHSSPATTMNLYVHSKKDYKRVCMNKIEI